MIKGQRNKENAKRYDWLMGPDGQSAGGRSGSPAGPGEPYVQAGSADSALLDDVRLIKYDFEKYGKSTERRRLLERWSREVESIPR